jgi:hypothetical protein
MTMTMTMNMTMTMTTAGHFATGPQRRHVRRRDPARPC